MLNSIWSVFDLDYRYIFDDLGLTTFNKFVFINCCLLLVLITWMLIVQKLIGIIKQLSNVLIRAIVILSAPHQELLPSG